MLHPAVGQTFPHIVEKMGQWEQKGVFKKAAALKDAGGNLLDGMTPEDIAKTGEGLAFVTSLMQRLAEPELQSKITAMLDLMSAIDTSNVKPAGVLSLLGALRSPEGRQALGLVVEVLKATGKFSAQGNSSRAD